MMDWLDRYFYVFGIPMQNWMPLAFWTAAFTVAVRVQLKKRNKRQL
jgi:hypothetical protein